MAVVAGTDKPTAAQYNSVQTTINTVLSTRYGQTPASSQLALPGTSTKITSAAWGNLRSDILKANRHQLNPAAVGTLTDPTTSTKIAAADYNAYETMANACLTNSLLFPDTSTISTTTSLVDVAWAPASGAWGRTGRNTLKIIIRVDFPVTVATNAGYYFNSGGQIRLSGAFTGGTIATAGTKDFSWKSAANEMGTVIFGANSTRTLAGATVPGTGSSIGYNQLLSSEQLIFTKNTSTYTPNTIKIYARFVTPSIFFTIEYEDLNDPAGTYTIDEDVSATVTTNASKFYGSGTGEVDVSAYSPTLGTSSGTVIASPNP
jgi:hypothetical protein